MSANQEKPVQTNVGLPPNVHHGLRVEAARQGMSTPRFLYTLATRWLANDLGVDETAWLIDKTFTPERARKLLTLLQNALPKISLHLLRDSTIKVTAKGEQLDQIEQWLQDLLALVKRIRKISEAKK